jgi:hypothetical protein
MYYSDPTGRRMPTLSYELSDVAGHGNDTITLVNAAPRHHATSEISRDFHRRTTGQRDN